MKKLKRIASFLLAVTLTLSVTPTVLAEGETNMTGVSQYIGTPATSSEFSWQNNCPQGLRVTVVDGENGARISTPQDYTTFTGSVGKSFIKQTKIEYQNIPSLTEEPSYQRKSPPSGMPTVLFGTSGGGNNMEKVKAYFKLEEALKTVLDHAGVSLTPAQAIERGYKLLVEPVAYLTVKGKIYAVTATESAILSQQFNSGYVVQGMKHPKGKRCNNVPASSSDGADIVKAKQLQRDRAFSQDGYYCQTSACGLNPNQACAHQTQANPYTYHLSSVASSALPKSLYLEESDLGIPAGSGGGGNLSQSQIISEYGVGIVKYKDGIVVPPPVVTDGLPYDFIVLLPNLFFKRWLVFQSQISFFS